jgi:hypothetical protein
MGSAGGSGNDAIHRSGGAGRGDYGDLAALMNDLLGVRPQPSLSSAGLMSRTVAASISRHDVEPLLACLFWSRFIRSTSYRQIVTRLTASSQANMIVVGHADATRYDLLLLDSEYRGEPQGLPIVRANSAIRDAPLDPQMVRRVLRRIGQTGDLTPGVVSESIDEVAQHREFGVAIAKAPEQIPTFAVSPAIAVKNDRRESVATIGVIIPRSSGRMVATTADHAVEDMAQYLTVGGLRLVVLGRHPASDSCLLALPESISIDNLKQFGKAGPLRGIPPTTYTIAKFDGAASGPTSSVITAFDPSIIDPQPGEMSKVYTGPDTAPGDSGAALIDLNDHIIGFAYRRSRYDAQLQFSVWVSAEQVCMAHGLFGCG